MATKPPSYLEIPETVYRISFIDTIHVWLPFYLHAEAIAWLDRTCGHIVVRHPRTRDPMLRQFLRIQQPTQETLRWLLALSGDYGFLNRLDLALDLVFLTKADKEDAFAQLAKHLWRRHARNRQAKSCGQTIYFGPRGVRNAPCCYADRESKITGDLHTLHVEWRSFGKPALRDAGFVLVSSLLDLDHVQFWRKRLALADPRRDLVLNAMARAVESGDIERIPGLPSYPSARRTTGMLLRGLQMGHDSHGPLNPPWSASNVKQLPVSLNSSAFPQLSVEPILPDTVYL